MFKVHAHLVHKFKWTSFQRRWQYKSFLMKTPGGKFKCDRSNKWLVVKDCESIGVNTIVESQWSTIENSLNFCHQRWPCVSRTNCCFLKKMALKIFLTERIMRSQTPPTCDASGKLNFLLMFFWCRKTSIFYWFQLFRGFRDFSLSPLLNFIPLLSLTIFGVPLLLMNLHRARINDSVLRDSVTSMWIAWIVKQEKRHHIAVGQRNLCQR